MTSPEIHQPKTEDELCKLLKSNSEESKNTVFLKEMLSTDTEQNNYEPDGLILDLSEINQLVEFASKDMTVTVGTGMTFQELDEIISKENLHLPIDVASPEKTSLSKIFATNSYGSHLFGRGSLRDYVIGLTAIDSRGKIFHSGGKVVKNVAGYDLCKLLIGSYNTLAIVTELTFKLSPLPESKRAVSIHFNNHDEIESFLSHLNKSDIRPIICDLYNKKSIIRINHRLQELGKPTINEDFPYALILGFEGFAKELEWYSETIKNDQDSFTHSLIEYHNEADSEEIINTLSKFPELTSGNLMIQANTLPSQSALISEQMTEHGFMIQCHAGNGIIKGYQLCPDKDFGQITHKINQISEQVKNNQGYLTIPQCPTEWNEKYPQWGEAIPSWSMMKNLRNTLDPDHLLSTNGFTPVI